MSDDYQDERVWEAITTIAEGAGMRDVHLERIGDTLRLVRFESPDGRLCRFVYATDELQTEGRELLRAVAELVGSANNENREQANNLAKRRATLHGPDVRVRGSD